MKNKEILGLRGAYASIYSNLSESHFKVGDEVICKNSGMEGEVVKVDSEEKGKYYTVKREDGKMVKYAPDELKLESEENEDEMKEEVSYSAKKARAGEDIGKPGKMFSKIAKEAGKRYGSEERGKKVAGAVLANLRKEEFDIFDVILEHLVAEGYADTNQAALAIMANMSEEWKQSILEESKRTEYLQKKFNKENERKSGSAHTYIPGKQNTGSALQKARESERHMRGER